MHFCLVSELLKSNTNITFRNTVVKKNMKQREDIFDFSPKIPKSIAE